MCGQRAGFRKRAFWCSSLSTAMSEWGVLGPQRPPGLGSGSRVPKKRGQPLPGNPGPRRPGTLLWVSFHIIAANCRVWRSGHISTEAATCDQAAAHVSSSTHPARSRSGALALLGAWDVPSGICRGPVWAPPGLSWSLPGPGAWSFPLGTCPVLSFKLRGHCVSSRESH